MSKTGGINHLIYSFYDPGIKSKVVKWGAFNYYDNFWKQSVLFYIVLTESIFLWWIWKLRKNAQEQNWWWPQFFKHIVVSLQLNSRSIPGTSQIIQNPEMRSTSRTFFCFLLLEQSSALGLAKNPEIDLGVNLHKLSFEFICELFSSVCQPEH